METHEIISRKTLCGCFSLLRQSLNNWQAGNLYFLNSHALYHHLSALPCGKDTVGGILTQMESCIPMALTTDSLEKFLLAKSPAEAEDFSKAPKTDFSLSAVGGRERRCPVAACDGCLREPAAETNGQTKRKAVLLWTKNPIVT